MQTQINPAPTNSELPYNLAQWRQGYRSQKQEYDYQITEIDGEIPAGLTGTLFRNGPGLLDINDISVRHPFDGDGMICQITFQNGRAHFRKRFIQTKAYLAEIWHSTTLDCCTAGLCRRTCFCTSSAGHEDDGWLIVMVYDGVRDRSAVVVLDAADLTKGAIATLHLTHHIPYGLHGSWTDTVFIDDLANS